MAQGEPQNYTGQIDKGNLGSYPGYNYVRKITPLTANETRYMNLNQSLQTIVYYDGLGRREQTVQKGITPSKADLVIQQEYDNFGRNSKTWLPTPVGNNNGVYVNNITSKAITYRNDAYPYSEPVYEKSPLNRVLEQYGPGANWRSNGGHSVKTEYLTNNTNYPCLRYSLAGDNLVNNGNYADNSLYVTKTTDEDGKISFEMSDKSGRLILQRQMNGTTQHDTYYVYDDLGNLRYVLPPSASDATTGTATYPETTTRIKYFAYIYKYDYRNRCIEKKLPGADPVYYKYDMADRLIFSQDGEQRQTRKWTFTIPDISGRVVLQGECTNPPTAISDNVVAVYSNTASGMFASSGYTLSGVSFTLQKTHQVLYYDNYKFKSNWGSNYNYVTPAGFENKRYGTDTDTDKAKGLLTGYRIACPEVSDLRSVFYYDKKGRMIQSVSDNHMRGYEKEYINYSFSGKPVWKQMQHNTFYYSASVNITETYTYKYDHADRLTETYYKIDDESQKLLSKLNYDDLGRISSKSLHNNLISINYAYNIRNRLRSITSGQTFNETLYYETTYSSNTPAYNGNLSALQWNQSKNRSTRGYRFHYDGLNRLTAAQYLNGYNLTGEYDEEFEYNKMGCITRLKRYINATPGAANPTIVLFDDLRFGYMGNHASGVCDLGEPSSPYGFAKGNDDYSYTYNKNGSLKTDKSRGIAGIQYNSLNLPEQIQFTYGHKTLYSYDALGNKRVVNHQTVKNNMNVPFGITDANISYSNILNELEIRYCGHIVYEGGSLKYILTPEGFVMPTSHDFYGYYYSIKDHLGNVRAVIGDWDALRLEQLRTVIGDWDGLRQETNYYPSGLPYPDHHSKDGYNPELQPYKFGGKELDEMNGLRTYDFHARQRKMDIPVFDTMDPLCEKYPWVSPYAYCLNNPVNYIDPDGRDVWEINGTGEVVNRIKDKTQDAFFMVAKDADGNYQHTFTTDAEGNKNYNSISFKYGTVKSQRTTALNSTDSYDTYKVRGDANGTQMFEFMSQNTTVEWSQAKSGIEGDKGLNFLTTSHGKDIERGMSNLYSGQLYAGYTIRELNHNHPSNTTYPSGSFDYTDEKGNFYPTGTWGDIGFARGITNNRQVNRLNVPIFQIYLPANKSYINYSSNSVRSDYGR
jgi:RHS repeat-associated protein